jgi:hypothetical protein
MDRTLWYRSGTFAPLTMLKTFLLTLFTATTLCSALAQQPGSELPPEALQSCLLGTGPNVWTQLDLSPDQLERVRRVQEACKEECSVAGAKKEANPISTADGSTILSELDNILSRDQYTAWVNYCRNGVTEGVLPR